MSSAMKISAVQTLFLIVSCSLFAASWAALKEGDCEVCIKVLNKFSDQLAKEKQGNIDMIQTDLSKFCKKLKLKEDRFCYYIGGSEDSATSIIREVAKQLSYSKPTEKICEDLKKKDSQICELKYDKQIDLSKVDFKKLKVKDLKKILDNWDESNACKGCAEKSDYVKVIKELMPKYDPEAAKKREEL